mmetsp:Transcript_1060/g.3236  ORF Transcript_1060/g.3236 Transcript_1060/m.3236 type:complete len:248 (+) Transcript_1060:33-776(+)
MSQAKRGETPQRRLHAAHPHASLVRLRVFSQVRVKLQQRISPVACLCVAQLLLGGERHLGARVADRPVLVHLGHVSNLEQWKHAAGRIDRTGRLLGAACPARRRRKQRLGLHLPRELLAALARLRPRRHLLESGRRAEQRACGADCRAPRLERDLRLAAHSQVQLLRRSPREEELHERLEPEGGGGGRAPPLDARAEERGRDAGGAEGGGGAERRVPRPEEQLVGRRELQPRRVAAEVGGRRVLVDV